MIRLSARRWLLSNSGLIRVTGVVSQVPIDPEIPVDPNDPYAVFSTYTRNYSPAQYQKPVPSFTATSGVVFPAPVLQPSATGDIVGFNFAGPSGVALPGRIMKFGMNFAPGALKVTDNLEAFWGGVAHPVQIHVLAKQPDDSTCVWHALLITEAPALTSNQVIQAMLRKASAAPTGSAVVVDSTTVATANVASTLTYLKRKAPARAPNENAQPPGVWDESIGYWTTYDDGAEVVVNQNIDVSPQAMMANPFVTNTRYSGPLATEKRYMIDLGLALRMTLDITRYSDGKCDFEWELMADVCNRTGVETWGSYFFNWTATHNGNSVINLPNLRIPARTGYGRLVQTAYAAANNLNPDNLEHAIQFDAGYLQWVGVTSNHYLDVGVNATHLTDLMNAGGSTFRTNKSTAGVQSPNMGGTGDRYEISVFSEWQTAWIKTMDYRMRSWTLAQAEAFRHIQINYTDAAHGWLPVNNSPENGIPNVWTIPQSWLTNKLPVELAVGYRTDYDIAHAPLFSYLAYMITGRRMYGDLLQKEGSLTITDTYNDPRIRPTKGFNLDWCLAQENQVRHAGWAMCHVGAAYHGLPDAAPLKKHMLRTLNYTYSVLNDSWPLWKSKQGESYGWLMNANAYDSDVYKHWQECHFVAGNWFSFMAGSLGAKNYVRNFQFNIIGTMGALPDNVMSIFSKCAYATFVGNSHDPNQPIAITTWAGWNANNTNSSNTQFNGTNDPQIMLRAQVMMYMMTEGAQRTTAQNAINLTLSKAGIANSVINTAAARVDIKDQYRPLVPV